MTIYKSLYQQLEAMGLGQWAHELQRVIPERMAVGGHGTMPLWQEALQGLPQLKPSKAERRTKGEIGQAEDLVEIRPDELAPAVSGEYSSSS